MSTVIGSLVVEMSANVARLQQDMGDAKKHVNDAMEEIVRASELAKGALEVIGIGLGVAEFGEFISSALEAADKMGKMAEKAGVSVESLSRLSVAARLSDVDTQSLAGAMGKLDKNMVSAQSGTGAAADAFDALGISVLDAHGKLKSGDQVMAEVADKFANTADGAGKTAAAMAIFGKAGAELIPMLNGGSEELDKFGKLADQLGLTMDSSTARAAQDVNDRFQIMHMAAQGVGQAVMRDMLPTFTNLSEVMVDTATNTEMLHGAADTLSFALKGTVAIGMGVVFAFKEVGNAMGGLAAAGVAFAHGDLSSVSVILSGIKTTFDKDAADMSATMDKLWADNSAQQKKAATEKAALNFNPKGSATDAENQKILDAAQKLDEAMLASHEDAFTKQIEAWKRTEDQLTALGAAGEAARKVHEQAYSVFVDAEAQKRNDAAKTHLDAQYVSEAQYFAKMQIAADQYGKTAKQREDKRYQTDVLDYQARYDAALKDHHTLTLQEEEGFRTALDNINMAHNEKSMRDENSVANFSKLIRNGDYSDAMTMAQAMTAGLAQHSRAAFEVNKAASLATAIISTEKAVAGVLGEFPGPIGWGMAAVQAALGMAQISAIESASFGGGGSSVSAPSAGGGIPSLSTSPGTPVNVQPAAAAAPAQGVAAAAPRVININSTGGGMVSMDWVRSELIPMINQAAGDGVVISVNGN